MRRRLFVYGFCATTALLSSGCEKGKVLATGQEDEIVVFADTTTWTALQPLLRATFEDTVFTP
ncbi:MAG: hypothetical protein ACRDGA_08190, partial [Bacteroidota bacterium]